MSKSITAQLPQNRPKVSEGTATHGWDPPPASRATAPRRRRPRSRGRAQDLPAAPALARNACPVEHHPGHPARADQPAPVTLEAGRRHREDQSAALHLHQRRLGQHDRPDGHRGQVVELHPGRHARLRRPSRCPSVARHVASSHRAMQAGRRQHRHVARAEMLGRVRPGTVSSSWALRPACGPCPAAVAVRSDECSPARRLRYRRDRHRPHRT